MRQIDVSVATVARPGNYLESTLYSIGAGIVPKLIIGSLSSSYLDAYRDDHNYTIIEVTEDEWATIHDKTIWHRASWNYWRCLSRNNLYNNGVIVFEDDIIAATNWRKRLEETIDAIEYNYGDNYVLAMYSPYRRDGYKRGLLFVDYLIQKFFGTQGMYFPEKTRRGYASYIYEFGVKSYREPYDLLLKAYLKETGVHLLSTTPSLVQHIGVQTTGLGGRLHQSPSFLELL